MRWNVPIGSVDLQTYLHLVSANSYVALIVTGRILKVDNEVIAL